MTQPLLFPRTFARLPADHPPLLLVVVDTDEEFAWSTTFSRDQTSVRAMEEVPRFQALCDDYGITPVYAVDYPVATQRAGHAALREFADAGRATIGAHLALLGRTGALDRLRLSPEGMDAEQHRALTRALLRRGTRVFTFSFHSPSLRPGFTTYVKSARDLEAFLDRCRRYFDFFLEEIGGSATTPAGLRERLAPAPLAEPA